MVMKLSKRVQKINNIDINSIIIAIFICQQLIIDNISFYFKRGGIYEALSMVLFFICIKINECKVNIKYIFFNMIIIFVCMIQFLLNGINNIAIEYFLYFILGSIMGGYAISNEFSAKKILKTIYIIGWTTLPILYLKYSNVIDPGDMMHISYSTVVILIINITNIAYKQNIVGSIAMSIPYTLFMLENANRGAIISVLIYIVCILILRIRDYKNKTIFINMILGFTFITVLKFKEILIFIQSIIITKGIEIAFIEKTLNLIQAGNLDNGRSILYQSAKAMLIDNPITGSGIGNFELENSTYVHNVFYQIWIEFGFIFFIVFIWILILGVYYGLLNNKIKEHIRILILILLCMSMTRLSFSYVYWKLNIFWMCIVLIINSINIKCIKRIF